MARTWLGAGASGNHVDLDGVAVSGWIGSYPAVPGRATSPRVLMVATDVQVPGTNGGSTHVGEVFGELSRLHEVMLLARSGSSGPNVVAVGGRRPPWGLRHLTTLRVAGSVANTVRRFSPDVIYERGSSYGLGAVLSRRLGIPMITMVLDEHVSPWSLRRANTLITTDPQLVPAQHRARAVKVSWGANTRRFRPDIDRVAARERLGLRAHSPIVGYCGSFAAWHGLDTLVEAIARLGRGVAHVLMVGDGTGRSAIEGLVESMGLAEHFTFTGRVPYEDVPGMLAAADVCVAPFHPERHAFSATRGFALDPLKVFEYLALGKPTITVRAENIERLFDDDVHLRLYRAGDPVSLSVALADYLNDPARAAHQAAAGRERVTKRHTWEAHARHLSALMCAHVDAGLPAEPAVTASG